MSFVKRSAYRWRSRAMAGMTRRAAVGAKSDKLADLVASSASGGPESASASLGRVLGSMFDVVAPTLRVLDLSGSGWGCQEAAAFAGVLPRLTSCSRLKLSGNAIGTRGAEALAGALRGNLAVRLASLYVDGCSLNDAGTAAIFGALEENDTLVELNLDGNECGERACAALRAALGCNVALETLGLFRCGMRPEGAQRLAEGLEENVSLLNLLMSDNAIGDAGANALATALELNQSLVRLWVANNGIGHQARRRLADACEAHDPTAKYGKKGTAYSEASRQLYQARFGERTQPVELLCDFSDEPSRPAAAAAAPASATASVL